MDDCTHTMVSTPPREIDLSDDGLDLTICFSGKWRRAAIVVGWLLLFTLVPAGLAFGVWFAEQVLHFCGLLSLLAATAGA